MRVERLVDISLISGRLPMNPSVLSLVDFIRAGGEIPPVKLQMIGGSFKLKDGRHRVAAYKLLGITKIKAKYFDPRIDKALWDRFNFAMETIKSCL